MLFEKHKPVLDAAIEACAARHYWSPFIESPSQKLHPDGAHVAGKAFFETLLQRPFELDQPGEIGRIGCARGHRAYPTVDQDRVCVPVCEDLHSEDLRM